MTPTVQRASRETWFSAVDFRAKFAVFVSLTFLAALWDDARLGAVLALLTLAAAILAGTPRAQLSLMWRVMLPFFIVMLVTHGFSNIQPVQRLTGRHVLTPLLMLPRGWWVIGGRVLSREGLLYGVNVLCKSATFLLLVPLCISTTDPDSLVVGLVRMRVPYTLAFVAVSSLRFFPLLFEEVEAVKETQRLRGFALERMGLARRVSIHARIAVPVILGALYKAQQIEMALQAKAFSASRARTYLHATKLRGPDLLILASTALFTLAAVWLYFRDGVGRFWGG